MLQLPLLAMPTKLLDFGGRSIMKSNSNVFLLISVEVASLLDEFFLVLIIESIIRLKSPMYLI